jgi:hypothetical protein
MSDIYDAAVEIREAIVDLTKEVRMLREDLEAAVQAIRTGELKGRGEK